MKLTLLILLLLFPFSILAQQNKYQRDAALFSQARILYDEMQYDKALEIVNQLIENDNTYMWYYYVRGNIYLQKNAPDTAIANFSTGLLLAPEEPILYAERANAYYDLQMPDESIEDYTSALKYMDDADVRCELFNNRGNARALKRDFEGACRDYKMALEIDSTNVQMLANMGGVLGDMGRDKEAIMYLEKALRLSPNTISAIGNLGLRYTSAGDYKKAIEKFNKIIELAPDNALAYNNMGYAKYKMNKLKEALKDIEYSIKLLPENSYAYKNRALVYLAMKQTDKACADLMLAANLGFTARYGDEVQKLIEKYCIFKNL